MGNKWVKWFYVPNPIMSTPKPPKPTNLTHLKIGETAHTSSNRSSSIIRDGSLILANHKLGLFRQLEGSKEVEQLE